MEQKNLAEIGVFGGSGFYKFLDNVEEVKVETPYGMPSDNLMIGPIGNHKVAFMPRHGRNHTILPHLINPFIKYLFHLIYIFETLLNFIPITFYCA